MFYLWQAWRNNWLKTFYASLVKRTLLPSSPGLTDHHGDWTELSVMLSGLQVFVLNNCREPSVTSISLRKIKAFNARFKETRCSQTKKHSVTLWVQGFSLSSYRLRLEVNGIKVLVEYQICTGVATQNPAAHWINKQVRFSPDNDITRKQLEFLWLKTKLIACKKLYWRNP